LRRRGFLRRCAISVWTQACFSTSRPAKLAALMLAGGMLVGSAHAD
jgi:hypothetical protein